MHLAQGYEYTYNVTNVEYTEFDRLGVADECLEGSQYSRYPANTNVLYIGLEVGFRFYCHHHLETFIHRRQPVSNATLHANGVVTWCSIVTNSAEMPDTCRSSRLWPD